MQARADEAYERGMEMMKSGELKVDVSERITLGNFIDEQVRSELRERYNWAGIDSAIKGAVRLNRREYDSSATDLTFRRPDARVGDVAFDVTLTAKTLKTAQVRGFFNGDFRPLYVVIVRPSQTGSGNIYVITRPGVKR